MSVIPRRGLLRVSSVVVLALSAASWLACLDDADDEGRVRPEEEGFRLVMADAEPGAPLAAWRTPGGDFAYVVGGRILDSGPGFIWRVDLETEYANNVGGAPAALWWIHGVSDSEMWVVGESGFAGFFSGRSVRELAMPPTVDVDATTLYGVWTASGEEVWAVGAEGPVGGAQRGLLLRSTDGSTFEEVDYGWVADAPLYKVWGSSANDVFVVGGAGIILHWDGVGWTRQESGTTERLGVVHGRGPTQVWAAGGDSEGILLRYDGVSWRRDESLPAPSAPLFGLWVAPEDGYFPDPLATTSQLPAVLYVCGRYGTVARRYENDAWVVQDAYETLDVLHSVVGWDTSRAFAVGGNLASGPPFTGVILALGSGYPRAMNLDGREYYRGGRAPSGGGGGGGGGFQ